MNALLPLTESEAIFAPFHDPTFHEEIPFELIPGASSDLKLTKAWAATKIDWSACEAGSRAAALELPLELPLREYDALVLALTFPPEVTLRVLLRDPGGEWNPLGEPVEGGLTRQEIVRSVAGMEARALRLEWTALKSSAASIKLTWFALRNSQLAEAVARNRIAWDPQWSGLIHPEAEWGEWKFRYGLLLDEGGLADLAEKKKQPHWADHFAKLEKAAQKAMERRPEEELRVSDFAPFADDRYVRAFERGREPLYHDALRLAVVGLVNGDRAMIRHALRFLMAMLHLRHWCCSAEHRVPGSTWDQRCFTEEMMTTAAALLMDWLDAALTDRARVLGRQMLWDRGLAVIERDMAKFEYVHHINQGPWFCRARIFAGLILEKEFPRYGRDPVDRAVRQLREGMDAYLQPDGGMDEGPMYLLLTLETVVPPLMAYAKARGLDVKALLPESLAAMPEYLATLAGTAPGTHVPDSDCGSIYPNTDTYAILAGLFPGAVYDQLAAASMLSDRPFTYSQHYVGTGVFSFLLGPRQIDDPAPIEKAFTHLPDTGLTSSCRSEGTRCLRLVFFGSKAKPSHAHLCKGAFVAEVDGEMTFIDRGILRYDDPRVPLLKRTENHNLLAPSFDDATTVEQCLPKVPVIPAAEGDEQAFRARLDLEAVWPEAMRRYRRRLISESVHSWWVDDAGELVREGRLVFILNSLQPFRCEDGGWVCGRVRIEAPWAERADAAEHCIDCENRPVHRLRLWSPPLRAFELRTDFSRIN